MDAFLGAYNQVIYSAGEGPVAAMMSFILGQAFPGQEGYIPEPQYQNSGGFTDVTTAHWQRDNQEQLRRTPFLITQTKRANRAGGVGGWHEGEEQLNRYLRPIAHHYPRVYGIVAIGRSLKFYQYSHNLGRIMFLHSREGPYDARDNARAIINRLNYIKNNH
ncbi:hypothetical protein BDW59DRAFT_167160 [Aspergillus cavernicola]|uniref:Uncharacterized protein n=1 Tax=Aspergillus cavernicola TaxID=176166 RepID=A0ABR4HH87_9EURO